jgi:hypothetical protein
MLRYFLILSLFVSSCAKTQHHKRKRKFVSTFGAETELHRSYQEKINNIKGNCADSNNLIKEHIKSITGIDGFCIFGDAAFCERAFNYIWWNQTASFDEKPSCYPYPPDLLTTIIAGYTSDDIFDKEKTYCDTTGDPENTGDLEWTKGANLITLSTPSETCMCPHLAIIETCTVDI